MALPARLKHLAASLRAARPRQLLYRPRRWVPPRILALGIAPPQPPALTRFAAGLGIDHAPQHGPVPPPDAAGVFTAVDRSRRFGAPDFWSDETDGLLFLFHLHGFAPLASYAAGTRTPEGDAFWAEVAESWLLEHQRPSAPAWHPFPLSVRLVSWCAAVSAIDTWPARVAEAVGREIWRQAAYLRRTVEHDIGGNHVLKNATALCFAGVTVSEPRFLAAGLRLLARELPQQIAADGGHVERSPAYHREVVDGLADVVVLLERSGHEVPPVLRDALDRAMRFQAALAGPDGALPLFNDAWSGPAVTGTDAPVTELGDTGYVVLRHGADQVVLDVGPLCPPHLPPHAHADALSFVAWFDGRPLVVDPGVYAYTGSTRDEFRATRAHSTVEVDGVDQCVFTGDFRAVGLPRVGPPVVEARQDVVVVRCRHDGYARLADPVVHERTFVWWPAHGLVVADRLHCARPHRVHSRLPLAATPAGIEITAIGAALSERRGTCRLAPWIGTLEEGGEVAWTGEVAPDECFGYALLRPGAAARVEGGAVVLSADGAETRLAL